MIRTVSPFIIAVVAIALFFLFTKDEIGEIEVLKAEEILFDDALAQVREIDRLKERLESNYNNLSQENLARLERLLANTYDPVRLVYDISNIALGYGKKINRVEVSRLGLSSGGESAEEETELELTAIDVSFSIDATYNELLNFIRELEQSLGLINVKKIDFVIEEASPGQSRLLRRITLQMYLL